MIETALKEMRCRIISHAIIAWHQVDTVSKELPGIGWQMNVFFSIAAVLMFQAGFMVHIQ